MPFTLVINPGGTRIRIAVYDEKKEIFSIDISYPTKELEDLVAKRFQLADHIILALQEQSVPIKKIGIIISRGTTFHPMGFGNCKIDQVMVDDLVNFKVQTPHPSIIGPIVAFIMAQKMGDIPCITTDPISVDAGFMDKARITGLVELERKSLFHALNTRFRAEQFAAELGKKVTEINIIVAHLGTGFSIVAVQNGKVPDVNNANDMGPFSPQRSGALPVTGLAEFCFNQFEQGTTLDQLKSILTRKSGLISLLNTDVLQEIEIRIKEQEDKHAKLVLQAMAYQIAKEIAAMATPLKGDVDGIIITGGCAHSNYFINELLLPEIQWLIDLLKCELRIWPGEGEMEALAAAADNFLKGESPAQNYISWDNYQDEH